MSNVPGPSWLTTAASAKDAAIQNKIFGSRDPGTAALVMSN